MLTLEELVHDIPGSSQTFQMGLSTNEAYVGLVEQNVGQDVYSKYNKLESAYEDLYHVTTEYQNELIKYKKLSSEIENITKNIFLKEKDIVELEKQRKDLVDKDSVSPKEEKDIEKLTQDLYFKKIELQEHLKQKKELAAQQASSKSNSSAFLTRINKVKEVLQHRISSVQDEKILNTFNDKEFENSIEQDFVDSCLLPGEEKKEEEFRDLAKSRFCMMKLEAIYLEKVKDYSKNLLQDLTATDNCKQLIDVNLSKQVKKDNLQAKGLREMSTEFLQTSDIILNDKAMAKFYRYVYKQTLETEFAAHSNIKYANLPGIAMNEFKIPQNLQLGVKGSINKILKGYSTTLDLECLTSVFYGVKKLHEAEEITNVKEQDNERRI